MQLYSAASSLLTAIAVCGAVNNVITPYIFDNFDKSITISGVVGECLLLMLSAQASLQTCRA